MADEIANHGSSLKDRPAAITFPSPRAGIWRKIVRHAYVYAI